jgi:hypothetical protein
MTDDCPNCETELLVSSANGPYYRWKCHGCGERWGVIPTEPIDYDVVDQWYESRSSEGTRLHTNPDCPKADAIITHSPGEARENRHERCLTCGHEVVQ